jgi:hypothetical protein
MNTFHMHGALLVVTGSCGTNMDHKKTTEKKTAMVLAEFKFRRLGKHLYGTKRL